eukprot:GEMP01075399.1.p1 GENE.GEMP01075399.1~~GEMP01075399.1.p1  ORF type:complete len:149 (+),score=28.74 GEMP01075399.1:582-1028(+)
MEHLQNNVGRNFEKGPTVLPLNWFENPAYTRTRFPAVDLVVAADIIYFPHLFKPLLTTMFALCRRPTTEVLVANMTKFPKFVPNLDRFLRMAHKMGFTVEKMCDKTMNGPPSAYSHMLLKGGKKEPNLLKAKLPDTKWIFCLMYMFIG